LCVSLHQKDVSFYTYKSLAIQLISQPIMTLYWIINYCSLYVVRKYEYELQVQIFSFLSSEKQ